MAHSLRPRDSSPGGSTPAPVNPAVTPGAEQKPALAPPLVDEFKFIKKNTFKDYVVYAVTLVGLVGVVGWLAYYFTRSEAERTALHERVKNTQQVLPLGGEGDGAGDGASGSDRESNSAKKSAPTSSGPAVNTSAYAGGQSGVYFSKDPQVPKPSEDFVAYARALKISGVLPGDPAKARLNGQLWRVGEVIEPALGITFAGVDNTQKRLLLRTADGAELRVGY
jgi:hypothetical protein